MSQPDPYQRKYDLTNNDGQDLRSQLDVELDDVARCFLETLTNLALIQRDDGELANKSVGVEQLKAELIGGFNPPAPFQPYRPYAVSDSFVTDDGRWFIVNTAFTATNDVDDNLDDVSLVYDFSFATQEAVSAKEAAEAAQGAAELARNQAQSAASSASSDAVQTAQDRQAAANSASSAAGSASSAALSAGNAANAEDAAEQAEANARALLTDFNKRYLGRASAPPTQDLNGDPLETGALYFRDTDPIGMYVWDGSAWQANDVTALAQDASNIKVSTATGEGQALSEALDTRVVVFPSIASLKTAPGNLTDGQVFYVQGYYEGTSTGGGYFKWDSSVADPDNGATVLSHSDQTSGRFVRAVGPDGLSIEECGALEGQDASSYFDLALSLSDTVTFTGSSYTLSSGFTIPDYKQVVSFSETDFDVLGTVQMGRESLLMTPSARYVAESVTTYGFSIIRLAKECRVEVKDVIGYRDPGTAGKGDGTVSWGVDADLSDFVNVTVHGRIDKVRAAFRLNVGAAGSGNTINGSFFKARYVSRAKHFVWHEGESSSNVNFSGYLEFCDAAYSAEASLYGEHRLTLDQVDDWFQNRAGTFKLRLGDVYIPDEDFAYVAVQLSDDFYDTTFHCRGGDIVSRRSTNSQPNMQGFSGSRLHFVAQDTSLRIIPDDSIETKISTNDTKGGGVLTFGDGAAAQFAFERQDETPVFRVYRSGQAALRGNLNIGDAGVAVQADLNMNRGDVSFGRNVDGPVIKDSSGARWRIKVATDGTLSTEAV